MIDVLDAPRAHSHTPAPDAPVPSVPVLPLVSSGDELREGREAAGVGLQAAAEALRLSRAQLQALELEQWDQLPGRPYIRAVLRAYARRLGVDATPLIEKVGGFGEAAVLSPLPDPVAVAESPLEGRDARRARRHAGGARLPAWLSRPLAGHSAGSRRAAVGQVFGSTRLMVAAGALALLLIGGFGAILIGSSDPTSQSSTVQTVAIPSPVGATSGAMTQPAHGSKQEVTGGLPAADRLPAPGGSVLSTVPATIGRAAVIPPIASRDEPAALSSSAGPSPLADDASTHRSAGGAAFPVRLPDDEVIHLHFSKKAWVEIRHKGGEKLLIGEQAANRSITVRGVPPMQVVLGNPRAVQIEFRGQTVDLKSRINGKGVARFTLK